MSFSIVNAIKFLLIFNFQWLQVPLEVTEPLDCKQIKGLKLGLSGDHQFYNAALAVSLCRCWLQKTGNWEKKYQDVG